MKLGRLNITFTKKPSVTEKYRAAYQPTGTAKPKRTTFYPGQYSWTERCRHYDEICIQYPLLKRALFAFAGLVTAQGVYFKPAETKPKKETLEAEKAEAKLSEAVKRESYNVAVDAAERADKLKVEQQVNTKFYETSFRAAKYGGCFWEITWEPTFSFRIPPLQECIEPAEADDQGTITKWRQIVNGVPTADWTNEELIAIPFLGEETSTWPFAPSLLAGTETETSMLVEMESSAKDYSEKQAWPYEALQLGDAANPVSDDEYSQARSEWRNRKPGEGIVTSVPTQILAGGTGSAPIRELAVLCELMKDNIVDVTMVPPISKLYNSTEASAKEMNKAVMTTLGQPWQWRLAEKFEVAVLKPWMEMQGFSRRASPITVFESPDVHKKEEGEYWTSLVSAKIQSPMQACEHLGLEYDEDYWNEQVKMEQEKFKQQLDAKAQSAPNDAKPEAKAKEVWRVEREWK